MRVLALYDIHANIDALDAVLNDPRAADADVVLVGGDALPGPFAAEILDRLEALETRWIRGNGEREVATRANEWGVLTADALGDERAAPLGDLPLTVTIDGVLYCHATPRDDATMLTRLSPPEAYELELADVEERVVVAGHTHQQHDLMIGDIRFVNAGSVGMPYEGAPGAYWLLVHDGTPEPQRTVYDVDAAADPLRASGFPDVDDLIRESLLDPVDAAWVARHFEERAAP